MSLTEVQQGQAQSLLKPVTKTPITPTTPPKKTTTSTTIPSWKYGPATDTAVQPTPTIPTPATPTPVVTTPVITPPVVTTPSYVPITVKELPSTPTVHTPVVPAVPTATGGYIPISVKEPSYDTAIQPTPTPTIPTTSTGGYIPQGTTKIEQITPHEEYQKSVEQVRQAPAGTLISKSTPILMSRATPPTKPRVTNIWQATYEGAQQTIEGLIHPETATEKYGVQEDKRWETWQKLPFSIKQMIKQGSAGTFENPFGIYAWKNVFLVGGEAGEKKSFYEIYDPYLRKLQEKFKSPLGATEYMAFETIPGAYYGFKGLSRGLGYVKGLGPTGSLVSQNVNRIIGTYFVASTIKGASEAAKQGPSALSKYAVSTGAMVGIGVLGMTGFKEGELAGTRKKFIGNLITDEQVARADTLFEAIDRTTNIPSKNLEKLDLSTVENLKGKIQQQAALKEVLASKEIKPYKVVLGGSAAGFETSPHDIDIYVARSLIGKKSYVEPVKNLLLKYGVDMSLYDIHDLPRKGESFPQLGTGYAQKPVRTAPGSDFKWQVSLSEQAGRKLASAWAPLHELRGKDWRTVMNIGEEYWNRPMEVKPSEYAKILERKGLVELFSPVTSRGLQPEAFGFTPEFKTDIDAVGVTMFPEEQAPILGVKKFLLPTEKQTTYAHELLHFEQYLETGIPGTEEYAYAMESRRKFYKPTFLSELEKWKPQTIGDKLVGPSYYETHTSEVPAYTKTWFERQLGKYGKPVTSKDLFTSEAWEKFAKSDAEAYRPQFIEKAGKDITDIRTKGVLFWSSGGAALTEGETRLIYPIMLPIGFKSYKTTPKIISYPKSVSFTASDYISAIPKYPAYTPSPSPKITTYMPSPSIAKTYVYPSYAPSSEAPKQYPPVSPVIPSPKSPKTTYKKYYTPSPTYTPSPPVYYPTSPVSPATPYPSYPPSPKSQYQRSPYPYSPSPETTPPPPRMIPPAITIPQGQQAKPKVVPGYDVYIKDRMYVKGEKKYTEKWVKANPTPLPEQEALSLGATATDQSAAASFKIRPTSGKAGKLRIPTTPWGEIQGKFYYKEGTYIESTQHRIDSPGEITGISALGWIAHQPRAYQPPVIKQNKLPSRMSYKPTTSIKTHRMVYTAPDINKMLRGMGY